MTNRLTPSLLSTLFSLSQCQKMKVPPQDQLPPATGTFGYLLSGQRWTPSGCIGRPIFVVAYNGGLRRHFTN
jgi:hypothetical protein